MLVRSQSGRTAFHIFLLCVVGVSPLRAQAVRPVIAEYKEKARGRFDVVNEALIPLNVVLEAKSFSVGEDGSPAFRTLDNDIHLKLSQRSFRVPPQRTYYVFYEATSATYPAWFVIYALFSGLPSQSGLNVQVELPHTVYLLQKGDLLRDEVHLDQAEFLSAEKQVRLVLTNSGDRLGRVSEVEVRGVREKAVHPGFPLMPRSRRNVVLGWETGVAPLRAIVRFKNFKVEVPLREGRN